MPHVYYTRALAVPNAALLVVLLCFPRVVHSANPVAPGPVVHYDDAVRDQPASNPNNRQLGIVPVSDAGRWVDTRTLTWLAETTEWLSASLGLLGRVPLEVRIDPQFLGASSPILARTYVTRWHQNFRGAPTADTLYPQALANALRGCDMTPAPGTAEGCTDERLLQSGQPDASPDMTVVLNASVALDDAELMLVLANAIVAGMGLADRVDPTSGYGDIRAEELLGDRSSLPIPYSMKIDLTAARTMLVGAGWALVAAERPRLLRAEPGFD